jgi:hypothetical protein
VTAALSPKSFPQSSIGRFEVRIVEGHAAQAESELRTCRERFREEHQADDEATAAVTAPAPRSKWGWRSRAVRDPRRQSDSTSVGQPGVTRRSVPSNRMSYRRSKNRMKRAETGRFISVRGQDGPSLESDRILEGAAGLTGSAFRWGHANPLALAKVTHGR